MDDEIAAIDRPQKFRTERRRQHNSCERNAQANALPQKRPRAASFEHRHNAGATRQSAMRVDSAHTPLAKTTLALFGAIPFLSYPHFRASLTAKIISA